MKIEITLKNYRCFADSKPARITVRRGFTAFIGVNNSGKTALLKFFYEFRNLFLSLASPNTWATMLTGGGGGLSLQPEILDRQEVFCNFNNRPLVIEFKFSYEDETNLFEGLIPKKLIIKIERQSPEIYVGQIFMNDGLITEQNPSLNGENITDNSGDTLMKITPEFSNEFKSLGDTLYIGSFRNIMNLFPTQDLGSVRTIQSLHSQYYDINVGLRLIQDWRQSKMGNDRKLVKRSFELQNDIKRIFDFDSLDINPSVNDQTIQFVINNQVYTLSEIGSGISQFFLILANVATKQPSYILIDEPELNLHPSLQLDFLTTLGNYAEHGILFSTHSIGLARTSAEQIYVVHKSGRNEGSEVIKFDETRSARYLSEFLGELSFSTYREFGFNKILLVEGPTDVKTIQQFLRKYGKDHEILLLPLGGSSLINGSFRDELQEIKRISENIYTLIDSEKDSAEQNLSSERQAFLDICREIGIKCHVLEYRATENYFPERAVQAIKGDNFSALTPYECLKMRSQFGWSKSDNWKMAQQMTTVELEQTDLGMFIKELIE
jgi:AAA15 family ATPase/GTPase